MEGGGRILNLKKLLTKLANKFVHHNYHILNTHLINTMYVEIASSHSFYVQRTGNLVVVNVDMQKKAVACPNVTAILTLPYGYRPTYAILDNITPQDNDGKAVMVYIQNNGVFNIFTPNAAGGRLTGSIVYFTNEDYPS